MNLQQYVEEGYKKDIYRYAYSKCFEHFTIIVFSSMTIIQFDKTKITLNRVISPSGIEMIAQMIYDTIYEEEES